MTGTIRQIKSALLLANLLILACLSPVLCQQPVEIKIKMKGEFLYIDSLTRLPEPKLRMNSSPAFLELTFPGGLLETKPSTKAIDKGLIQRVVTSQKDRTAVARIYVVTKPKTVLRKTETGFRYKISLHDMASAQKTRAAASPTAAPRKPGSTTGTGDLSSKPITIGFQNTPLRSAVAQMAEKVGMASSVDASIEGVVTRNFQGVPFRKALETMLKPYGKSVTTSYSGNSVSVRKREAPKAPNSRPVSSATPRPISQPSTSTAASTTIVREYFPFTRKNAEKAMKAAQLAFPNISYLVDPSLNILMVEGTAQEIDRLEKFLRAQSPK